jgi:hypothetical protein
MILIYVFCLFCQSWFWEEISLIFGTPSYTPLWMF